GKANPPRRLRVRMMKDEDGIVIVSPYEEPTKKSERTATGTDEAIDNASKPEKEPIPETEKEEPKEPKEQSKTQEKEKEKRFTSQGQKRQVRLHSTSSLCISGRGFSAQIILYLQMLPLAVPMDQGHRNLFHYYNLVFSILTIHRQPGVLLKIRNCYINVW
ncbi:MAG TPA: hypothetical protein VE574_05150, partial [Nitrososphaeraceae archaeon]|nr:hypothetical protein [Nitrososphaeraceae archaeon]